MKILTTGHKYELASFEGGPAQSLQFIEKERVTKQLLDEMAHSEQTPPL